ncbi:MAG: iron ABC transporter permease [Paludibacteraceae bacterium]|nr:iron ABC transporter permease [Paludibacteraceae bacterium]
MKHRQTILFIGLVVLLALLACLDVCCGSVFISPLTHHLSSMDYRIIHHLRLPKMLTAILAGAALSVSGLTMQTLFRNPLAGPYILGVSSGASLGVALVTMLGSMALGAALGNVAVSIAAICGSAVVLLIMLVLSKRVHSNVSLLIIGMMLGAIAGALVNVLQNYSNPDALKLFIVWTLGSLSNVGWQQLSVLACILCVGFGLLVLLVKPLNGLLLGDDYARALGVNVPRVRLGIVLTTGLLAGGVTAFCGPIAFVGVAVPHIARGLCRTTNHRITVPVAALVGADLLLLCDILCSLSTYPLPISTMSSLFGAPIIIWILIKKKDI